MRRLHIFAFICLCLPLLAAAGEAGQTLASADLKKEPFADAATLANLPANTVLDVLKRQGGWMQVKPASGAEGWLKMSNVKLGTGGSSAKGDSGINSLLNVASTGRSGNTGVTVATGVRGLSPEDMKNAQPNPEELKKLDNYAANRSQAESLASKGKLSSQKIDYLADKSTGGKK